MKIRVQMPDIQNAERWKRGRVETVKTQAEADNLIAQGGKILAEGEEPAMLPPRNAPAIQEPHGFHRADPDPVTASKAKGGK